MYISDWDCIRYSLTPRLRRQLHPIYEYAGLQVAISDQKPWTIDVGPRPHQVTPRDMTSLR